MQEVITKARSIKLLILDVDGVLTDGGIYLDDQGVHQLRFHIHDGLGIKLLLKSGVQVAIITGRQSHTVALRAQMLGITHLFQGNVDKRKAYQQLREQLQLEHQQIAYVGDDLPDLPLLQIVGLSIAVANARETIKRHCHWQTQASGGFGAVREVCELIMHAQETWSSLENEFYAR